MLSRSIALLLVITLLAAACGGSSKKTTGGVSASGTVGNPQAEEGTPQPGGEITYAQEAEDTSLCLQEAQLDISGINYARTIYDTLTVPNEKGDFIPYLAKSVTPNATFDQWTIVLRDGIKFQDGSALDSTVVMNNLNAYRGTYPARHPLLFSFVFSNVADVTTSDAMTVVVKTKTPWPAFPAFLWSSARLGIAGQAQLDSPACANDLIGTGPFMIRPGQGSWVVGDHFTAVKNPNYWQKDKNGVQFPYLDSITFKPIADGQQRLNGVISGQIQAAHTSSALDIEQYQAAQKNGQVGLVTSDKFAEISYYLLNDTKAPFNNIHARKAFALALDRKTLLHVRAHDLVSIANGPFAPGAIGYLENTGFPDFNLDQAKSEVQAYKTDTGQDLSFNLGGTPDPEGIQTQQLVQSMLQAAGMNVSIGQTEQAQYISDAIGKNFVADGWRNHPGSDPDTQYVWWHCDNGSAAPAACDNPVNFSGFNDPVLNDLMDQGRKEADPAKRPQIYEDLNREFAKQLWDIWTSYTLWGVGASTKLHGIMGPDLPDGSKPFPGLATGHPMLGLWMDQ